MHILYLNEIRLGDTKGDHGGKLKQSYSPSLNNNQKTKRAGNV
jgi:hypothetical protein